MGNYDKTQDIERLEEELKKVSTEKEEEVQIRTSNRRRNFNKLRIKYKKDKKKYLVMLLGLFVMISSLIGTSFAYLTYVSKTDNSTIITAGTLALILQNEENVISISNALPMKDEEGLAQQDEYSFEVRNNGTIPESYKITLNNTCTVSGEVTSCIPDDYIKIGLKIGNNDYKIIEKNEQSEFIIDTGDLGKGQVQSYKMKIWLSYDTPTTYNTTTGVVQYSGQLGISYAQSTAKVWNYDFTGNAQKFIAPYTGEYKVELWGAQGGSASDSAIGGKGAYTVGTITVDKRTTLYVYVGENPTFSTGNCLNTNANNAFNASSQGSCTGGGGATDIRLTQGENWYDQASLASRIMVAAGGGGAQYTGNGGDGGKITASAGVGTSGTSGHTVGAGASQTQYTFGQGTKSTTIGGGGYYGGQGGTGGNAGGGSSYISGYQGCIAITGESNLTAKCTQTAANSDVTCSYHYSEMKFTSPDMKAGNETMPDHNGMSTMTGNTGNGYAKITFIKKSAN